MSLIDNHHIEYQPDRPVEGREVRVPDFSIRRLYFSLLRSAAPTPFQSSMVFVKCDDLSGAESSRTFHVASREVAVVLSRWYFAPGAPEHKLSARFSYRFPSPVVMPARPPARHAATTSRATAENRRMAAKSAACEISAD